MDDSISSQCVCGANFDKRPFSPHFDVLVCVSCACQHFVPVPGLPVRRFGYNSQSTKYSERNYLLGRELRWSHQRLLEVDWKGRHTLEIGCFNGFFVSELLAAGSDAHGVELNEQALRVGSERFGLSGRLHATLDLALGHAPFDDLLCIDVLEHMEDPLGFLAQASALLRPNGRVFIAGPTIERRFFDKTDYPPHHQWRFSRPGLARLLERSGFDVRSQLVQHDGMLLVRNFVGKVLNGPTKKEFYGDITITAPSTEKGFGGVAYRVLSKVGTALFTKLRIPYCSAVLVGEKEVRT